MLYKLPKLPYSYSALEPYIDKMTMRIHHTKHHQAYVDNLNKALQVSKFKPINPDDLLKYYNKVPAAIQQTVINNAGGHVNHTFFWQIMTPHKKAKLVDGKLKEMLESKFGSIDNFKSQFSDKAMSLFGSGWVFLTMTATGQVKLKRHSFQNSPLMQGNVAVLGIDLWEHAYYLKYQNRKADYIKAWWNVVNWDQVEKNYLRAK